MPKKNKTKKEKSVLFTKLFDFIKPFLGLMFLSILLNTIFSSLNAITITLIKPVFSILFPNQDVPIDESTGLTFFESIKEKFFGFIFDIVQVQNDPIKSLINLSILIIILFFAKNLFKYLGVIASVSFEQGVIKSIRDKLFTHITFLSVDFFSKSRQGNIISIITNDVNTLNQNIFAAFNVVLRTTTQVIIFLFLLLGISTQLTLIAFSTSIISFAVIRIAIKYLKRYGKRMQTSMADYTTTMQETIEGIRVVKAYNAQETAVNRFIKDSLKYFRSAIKHRKVIQFIPSINELLAISALSFVLVVGGSRVLEGEMKPDDLITFLFALFAIMSPIASLINSFSKFQLGFVAADRIFSILDEKPSIISGEEKVKSFEKAIEIRNLSFKYEDEYVLKNINLSIAKNKKVAFVGPSGSGKSTMLDLLIRFYDPQEGEISFDGKNIKDIDIKEYRNLFGIVSQDTILFNDTIENNILYGKNVTDKNKIIEAASSANALNFIENLSEGFESNIGDKGVTLSGGERQRIAIARALLREPEILIFDEATSALDAESEKVVQDAINKSLEHKTAILVAHRLATIIDCDEIVVFDRGEIVEKGSHQELIAKNGVYKNLYDIQFAEKALTEKT